MILYDQNGAILKTNDDLDQARCLTQPQYCASTITWKAANGGPYYLSLRTLTWPDQQYPQCPCPGYTVTGKALRFYLPLIIGGAPSQITPTPTATATPTLTPTPVETAPLPTVVPGFRHPKGLAVNPQTHLLYVASRTDDRVYMLDSLTLQVLNSVKVGKEPWGVAVNTQTNKVYIANFGAANVYVLDGATLAILEVIHVGPNPTFVGINEATNRVFVVTYGNSGFAILDGASDTLLNIKPARVAGAWGLAVNSNLNRLYISGRDNRGEIATLDGNAPWNAFEQFVYPCGEQGSSAYELDFNPANNKLYVACAPSGSVNRAAIFRVSAGGLTRLAWTPIGAGGGDGGGGVAVNPTTGNAFFTNALDNTVSVISGSTNTVIATIPTGVNPFGLAVDPATGRVYVGDRDSNDVFVFRDPSAP